MKITVLGATGSVGRNVLDVSLAMDGVEIYAISANRNTEMLYRQISEYNPKMAAISDSNSFKEYDKSKTRGLKILKGRKGVNEIATADEVDLVFNALSGMAGLEPTVKALKAGKRVASANKESIVMGWHLIRKEIKYEGQFIPVDSEHSALLQLMKGEDKSDIKRVILTASGGAVYRKSIKELEETSPRECLNHPTWDMGFKITIDSATLMNKGLEIIEACNIFELDYGNVDVFIHPQSIVHAFLELSDGSVVAHMGVSDMRIPIQYAITHPRRVESPARRLRVDDISNLEFETPDVKKFPCLKIAVEAGKTSPGRCIQLCAADEAAVKAFGEEEIGFMQIPDVITREFENKPPSNISSYDKVEKEYNIIYKRVQKELKEWK